VNAHTSLSISHTRPAGIALVIALLAALIIPVAQPAEAGPTFGDDNGIPHESAIEYMAAKGVTKGCNPPVNDRFCPDRPVTRGEMAAFLERAFELSSGSTDHFKDDDRSPFETAINAVAKAGVTKGCNPPANDRFCPNAKVTRGEMAAFINRILDLDKGGDFFGDDDGSVFEADINAIARVGISKGCNPPANDRFCERRNVTRAEMATFLHRTMEIERTGSTTTTTPATRGGGGGSGGGDGGGGEAPPPPPSSSQCVGVPLKGPSNPKGDVTVQPGQSIQAAADRAGEGATIVIAKGVHKNQTVSPKHHQKFIGQPGAVLDGGGSTEYAFGGPGDDVLIEGLEIRNYDSELKAGVVRSVNSSLRWTVRANKIHNNGGQGLKFSSGWRIIGNHLHHNEQFGIAGTGNDILIEKNEISFNNHRGTVNPYSGAGGTKIVRSRDVVFRENCSHDNDGPGLWTDGHNVGVIYEGNLVYNNTHAGIKHEISCAATIRNNTAIGNGFGNPNWLAGAGIVVINSPNVVVTGNRLKGNADGIGGIQGERDGLKPENCQLELRDLLVEGNTIDMADGYTGIVTNQTGAVFTSWGNRFRNNDYELSPSNGEFFRWSNGSHLTLKEWKAAGQG
jgi:parallel beta-helix repeat protein